MSCVLTLALDDAAQARFEVLRQRWFPPERNQIPAHVTLFHHLPEAETTAAALRAKAQSTPPMFVRVQEVRSLGRGVAFFLESPEAIRLHRALQAEFSGCLNRQDMQGFRPHVVVQNKVEPRIAKETMALLQAGFASWECEAVGMDLWRYLGGPWKLIERIRFSGPHAHGS